MRAHNLLLFATVSVAIFAGIFHAGHIYAQIPIPLQEQIERFSNLPSAQQQALIRELQTSLPPAQRDAILSQLMQQGRTSPSAPQGNAGSLDYLPQHEQVVDFDTLRVAASERLIAGATLVVRFQISETVLASERTRLQSTIERLEDANPYRLDDSGLLYLPGVRPIELSGLNEEQATVRIEAESSLRGLDVTLTYLPLDPVGVAALRPFGYGLFSGLAVPSQVSSTIPIPTNYVVGPGDTVNIQLFGSQNQEYFLPVSREGRINLPQIGPITVSGLTFEQVRNTINERIAEQMIGVRASTTLGELRSIQIAVLGEAERPGSYTVSGTATITGALYESGGVNAIGSLRSVRLMRNGELVTSLDIYDLLLRGDTQNDVRLEAGDAIFIPTVGPTVAVDGEVRRPGIYELLGESTMSEIIALAGGLAPSADESRIKLERVVSGRGMTMQDVDLTATDPVVRDGDRMYVESNLEQLENSIRLVGNVMRPGIYQWRAGMTLRDLLPSPELVKSMSDVNYVLIRREDEPNLTVAALSADIEAIWQGKSDAANPVLQPRDTVTVFNIEVGRGHVIGPLLAELDARGTPNEPSRRVSISGSVGSPGQFPLEPGMRITDLVRAGGGLRPSAYLATAELARYEIVDGERRETELVTVDLSSALEGAREANVLLQPYDHLTIKETPRWREQQMVELAGEVQFPGQYPIRQGETLSSVLARAGGLTDLAFSRGSLFTRVELKEREAERLENLARRIETDLAADALTGRTAADVFATGQALISQLRTTEAVGRLVIDLESIVAGDSIADVVLRDGDQLLIPPVTQEVMVLGEVQNATSHLYSSRLDRDDYINMSGGMTNRADRRRVYIVRASGSVVSASNARWFSRANRPRIEPGDTVIVPINTDRLRPLTAAESITQVLYNIAVAFSVIDRI